MKHKDILSKMSIEEKLDLCCGADFWRSVAFRQYGIPSMTVSDGPHGLRYQEKSADNLGINESAPATCFPTAAATACSWDNELIRAIGEAIGKEAASHGVGTVLGPGINIKRNPLCGRNFEYYSEDPYLSGIMGAAFVKGVQENGVGACLKHFAANSQEYKRFSSGSHIDERTLRELYFSAFEYAIKNAKPAMVMCAYNKINGVYCSDNRWLLTEVLRDEWGFDGMVVTDWGAMHDRAAAFNSGCDWSMPGGGTKHLQNHAMEAINDGLLSEDAVDICAGRILSRALASSAIERKSYNKAAHHALARRAAAESAVLLKNDGILPLAASSSVALIGHMAKHMRFQGAGSSHINPTMLVSLADAAPDRSFAEGCDAYGDTNDALIEEAVNTAKASKFAVVVAGLPEHYESEGFDRDDMRMPDGHIRLIEAVAKANPNTIVVLLCGSPVETPWLLNVRALLYMGLPGQAGGEAIIDILTGAVNPSGKLAETWPMRYEDVPCASFYGEPHRDAYYQEGLYVGYRYYESANTDVRFPFGFGLSYTEFVYSDIKVSDRRVSLKVKNIGDTAGAEVVQLYISPPKCGPYRPNKELKGFVKVYLEAGQSEDISFTLDERSFAQWRNGWKVQGGKYQILLASSVRDVRLCAEIMIEGEELPAPSWQEGSWYSSPKGQPNKKDFEAMLGRRVIEPSHPKKGELTMENTLLELAEHSLICRITHYFMKKTVAKANGGKADNRNATFRMAYASSADCGLFNIVINSCGAMPEYVARGLLDFANGHPLRGLKALMRM